MGDGAPEPPAECWIHQAIEVRPSPIEGHGLFATAPLPVGTVVMRLGGRLVTTVELRALIAAADEPGGVYVDTITVGEDRHLVMPPKQDVHYGNHSCDPTAWHLDAYTIGLRRAVAAGEEITVDYATQSGLPGWTMECRCGSPSCRGTLTGDDWRRPELQQRYGEHWVPLLRSRIDIPRLRAGQAEYDGGPDSKARHEMKDRGVMNQISALVDEERRLLEERSSGQIGDEGQRRLAEVEVELDQCWDFLRQRRAARAAGRPADSVGVRDAETVRRYQQ